MDELLKAIKEKRDNYSITECAIGERIYEGVVDVNVLYDDEELIDILTNASESERAVASRLIKNITGETMEEILQYVLDDSN